MPIPKPNKDEDNQKFVARCMSDEVMKKEYPDSKQRVAICLGQTKSSLIEQVEQILAYQADEDLDEDGEEVTPSNIIIPDEEDYLETDEPTETWDLYTLAAEYQGRKVTLNKPFRTPNAKKKFAVYVKKPDGKVVIVRFGSQEMSIKRDDPKRRKSFRARHGCDNPGPKYKAKFWSCFQWRANSPVQD